MKFIGQHINKILIAFAIAFAIIFIQNCSNSRRISKVEKQEKAINARLDSIPTTDQFQLMLTIEGLKSEKRMIQATDRKILDVNRQSAIDEELKKLEAKRK